MTRRGGGWCTLALLCGCTSSAGPSAPLGTAGSSAPVATSAAASSRVAVPAPPQPKTFGKARQVELGGENLCVLAPGGTAQCVGEWPLNFETATSSGSRNQYLNSPVGVGGLSSARRLAVATNRACAILDGGGVACWGNTVASRNGWSGAVAGVLDAVAVPGLHDVEQIALGWNGSCALVAGGTVTCWGPDLFATSRQTGPVEPPRTLSLTGVRQIAAAYTRACALLDKGTVSCWGEDRRDGRRVVPVPGLAGIAEIALGSYHACARTTAGEVLCWGNNGSGVLGDGTTDPRTTPVEVVGIAGAKQVAVADSSRFSCALLANDDVVCWGENINCSLGDARPLPCQKRSLPSTFGASETEICPSPQRIVMPIKPARISLGATRGCAESATGEIACWGRDPLGGANRCSAQVIP